MLEESGPVGVTITLKGKQYRITEQVGYGRTTKAIKAARRDAKREETLWYLNSGRLPEQYVPQYIRESLDTQMDMARLLAALQDPDFVAIALVNGCDEINTIEEATALIDENVGLNISAYCIQAMGMDTLKNLLALVGQRAEDNQDPTTASNT